MLIIIVIDTNHFELINICMALQQLKFSEFICMFEYMLVCQYFFKIYS